MKLNVIITSTRPGRVGGIIGEWFAGRAKGNSAGFDVVLTDLAELNLPIFNEPRHPVMQDYEHEHTKRWAKTVADSDAFVFVLPEYNYTAPPSFFNAVSYLSREWNYKPASFVSYGGASGGIRAAQTAKTTLTTLNVMPIVQQVMIPMAWEMIKDGALEPTDIVAESADTMVVELAKWAGALKTLR